jgi:hypothetical protein
MRFMLTLLCLCPVLATAQPSFTLDQATGRTGAQLNYSLLSFKGDGHARRLQVFGEFGTTLDNGNRAGGYLSIGSGTLSNGDATLSGSNLVEAGGLYVFALGDGHDVVTRLGLTLPQGGIRGAVANLGAAPARLTDLALAVPDAGIVRLSVSPRGRAGNLFYRVDAGIDVGLFGENGTDVDPIGRVNFMGGIDVGAVALQAELNNLLNLTDLGDGLAENMLHAFTVGTTFEIGQFTPGVGLTIPLDEEFRDGEVYVVQATVRGTL